MARAFLSLWPAWLLLVVLALTAQVPPKPTPLGARSVITAPPPPPATP
jgi:hypothetical protein